MALMGNERRLRLAVYALIVVAPVVFGVLADVVTDNVLGSAIAKWVLGGIAVLLFVVCAFVEAGRRMREDGPGGVGPRGWRSARWPLRIDDENREPRVPRDDSWLWPRRDSDAGLMPQPVKEVGLRGRYQLIGLQHRGGQAAIWAGRDVNTNDSVAVKVPLRANPEFGASLPSSARDRVLREAQLLSGLTPHRNVIQLLDWGPSSFRGGKGDGNHETQDPWLVLPYLAHRTLPQAMQDRQGEALGIRAAYGLGTDLAAGLHHLHKSGITHRDLSTGNVLLTRAGAVIADLGMAYAEDYQVGPSETRPVESLTNVELGPAHTPHWAAPEILWRRRDPERPEFELEADRRSPVDIFNWGLLVFAACLGFHPWSSAHTLELSDEDIERLKHAEDPADVRLPHPLLDRLVWEALSFSPNDRPSARDLVEGLKGQSNDAYILWKPSTPLGPNTRRRRPLRIKGTPGPRRLSYPLLALGAALTAATLFVAYQAYVAEPSNRTLTTAVPVDKLTPTSPAVAVKPGADIEWATRPVLPVTGKNLFTESFRNNAWPWKGAGKVELAYPFLKVTPTLDTAMLIPAPSEALANDEVVTATAALSPGQGIWGVWCRGISNGSGSFPTQSYQFLISHTAAVAIWDDTDNAPDWHHLAGVNVNQPLTISGRCTDGPSGVRLTMAVNGRVVLVRDATTVVLGPGSAGISAATFKGLQTKAITVSVSRFSIVDHGSAS